jgi:outer membrane lipoprotein-sorting protein
MLFLMGFVDQADRILENEEIGEVECFGFEVRSKKYGDYPDGMKNRWWFDVKTKLPVRMELVWLENGELRQPKTIKEHFDWKPELDEETFIPKIPDGFQLIDSNGG